MFLLRKTFIPQIIIKRNINGKYNWYDEGIKYFGFKYYPRQKDFKDPPYEPTKLFRVERLKPLKGIPHKERTILEEFQLGGEKNHCYNIIKNIPENNQRLYKVKHLVRIVPITFPDGIPKESDYTCLQENGELRIIKHLPAVDEKMKLIEGFRKDVNRLDGDTLRRHSRLKWLNAWD